MTHIITESCIKCKYTECVDACPLLCFIDTPLMLVIHPDECIDCGACVSVCPTNAIYAEEDTPEDQREFIKININLAILYKGKFISKRVQPLPNAEDWLSVKNKKQYLS